MTKNNKNDKKGSIQHTGKTFIHILIEKIG